MSSADGWDPSGPEDAAELLAELRRHGVWPGQRLHVVRASQEPTPPTEVSTDQPARRKLQFIGSVQGGPADLSPRTDEYLQRGFAASDPPRHEPSSSPLPGPPTPTTPPPR